MKGLHGEVCAQIRYAIAALARVALILAFSHQGRRDLSLAILVWLRAAGLASPLWIPAFAGMTGEKSGMAGGEIGNGGGEIGNGGARNREWRAG